MEKTIEEIVMSGNLDELTSIQRSIHYNNVCDAMDIDPRPHPLEYLNVDDPNGGRRLILYALKNCTDQLRARRKIKITKLIREITEDMITYTAEAEDKDGLSDISTGSVSTKGKKGPDLANASMTAETKAKRRVTLSISGSGLLDETEIADINAPTSLPAGMGVTAVAPNLSTPVANEAAGKEVKLAPKEDEKPVKKMDAVAAGVASLKDKKLSSGEEVPAMYGDLQGCGTSAPFTVQVQPDVQPAKTSATPDPPVSQTPKNVGDMFETLPAKQPDIKADISPADQKEALNRRITTYKRDILPSGGMRPSKGYGINAKFTKFLTIQFPDRKNINEFSNEDLTAILDRLDKVRQELGEAGVVALIDTEIGTK